MACAAEMCMRKTNYAAVFVLVASAIPINIWLVLSLDSKRNGIGVGAQLHGTKWQRGTRKGMPCLSSSNEWPDEKIEILLCPTDKTLKARLKVKNKRIVKNKKSTV